jgi:hypothetical protein
MKDEKRILKQPWSSEDDYKLKNYIIKNGPFNWSAVSTHLVNRTPKQCRERWLNHLDPALIKSEWTEEEDKKIISLQKEHGNQWVIIASSFLGRTDNDVKNRYHLLKRALNRLAARCVPRTNLMKRSDQREVLPSPSTDYSCTIYIYSIYM